MIDLDFYCWREATKDADGDDRLLVPWSDPNKYEHPFNMIFASEQEAIDYKLEAIERGPCILPPEAMATEDDCSTHEHEPAEGDDWVLVHYRGTVIPPVGEKWHDVIVDIESLATQTDEAIDYIRASRTERGKPDRKAINAGIECHMKARKIADGWRGKQIPPPVRQALIDVLRRMLDGVFGLGELTDDEILPEVSQPQEKMNP